MAWVKLKAVLKYQLEIAQRVQENALQANIQLAEPAPVRLVQPVSTPPRLACQYARNAKLDITRLPQPTTTMMMLCRKYAYLSILVQSQELFCLVTFYTISYSFNRLLWIDCWFIFPMSHAMYCWPVLNWWRNGLHSCQCWYSN